MPDKYGNPTDEDFKKWRARWTDERIADVIQILQKDPEWGRKKITELPWYTQENGFHKWTDKEKNPINQVVLQGRPILDLRSCPFSEANLANVFLAFCHFEGAGLGSANFKMANFSDANFYHANLSKGYFAGASFHAANLCHANLSDADFADADLSFIKASKARVLGTNFGKATLAWLYAYETIISDSDMRGANLSQAHLYGTLIEQSNLSCATLTKANLVDATLLRVDLRGSRLNTARLEGTKFINCTLNEIDLGSPQESARCNSTTFFGRVLGLDTHRTPWLFDEILLEEQNLKPRDARKILSEICCCFRANGLFRKEAIYLEQEEYWRMRE